MNIIKYTDKIGQIIWTEDFYTIKKSKNKARYEAYTQAVKDYGCSVRSFYLLDAMLSQYNKIDTLAKLKGIKI